MRKYPWVLAILAALGGCFLTVAQAQQVTRTYEVWAADQNANVLYVLDPDGNVLRTIDGATLGDARRPHMLVGVPKDEYVYSANTASNSVSALSARDGKVKAVIAGVGKAPHAAQPHPLRPEQIYVANIAPQAMGSDGKPDRGETISELARTSNTTWEVKRFLDLKSAPALADTNRFPSRRPVCAGFSKDGRHMLVTLFDGGLALVDLPAWTVVKGWGRDEIAKHGCGFAASSSGDELYVTAGDQHASWLYVFNVVGEPKLVAAHNLSQVGQDAHGAAIDPAGQTLWVVHRVSSNVTIHPLATIRQAGHQFQVIDFVGKTPDLIAFAPDHRRAYVTLRGPKPAPTIPHATVGETPGVAIIDVANRKLVQVIKLGDQAAADFHGIFIPYLEKDKS